MAADLVPTGTDPHRVLDTLSGALIAVDAHGRVTLANAEFRRVFGAIETGRPIEDVLDLVGAQMTDPDAFRRRARELAGSVEGAYEHVSAADGRVFERDYSPMLDEDGTYLGHVWQYWDVTEQQEALHDRERLLRAEIAAQQLGVLAQRTRAAEAEATGQDLAERNRALLETDLLRKELLATASHELRSPLISILNFSHMLADTAEDWAAAGTGDDDLSMFSAAITRNATRLLDLVDDLLLVARMDAGVRTQETTDVDLSALVLSAVQDADALGAPDRVSVDADVVPGVIVEGDGPTLTRAVANVLSNAVKYSHADSAVQVVLRRIGNSTVELVVADSGIGIPAEEMGALFGQFFRASTARSSGRPGTGLGLSIVRSIAEQHGGSIRLTSRVGEGTVATLTLPAR